MRLEVSIDIDKPTDVVWPIMTDVERWPQWTRSVTSISSPEPSPFGMGSRVRIRQPKLKSMVWQVSDFQPNRAFTWKAKDVGISVSGRHALSPNTRRGTTVTLTVNQTGWLAWLLFPVTRNLSLRYMKMEAEGLKKRCEGVL